MLGPCADTSPWAGPVSGSPLSPVAGASNGPRTFCPRPSLLPLQASNRPGFFHLKIFNNPRACKLMSMDLGGRPLSPILTPKTYLITTAPVCDGESQVLYHRLCLQLHLTPNRFQAWDVFYRALTKNYAALRLSEFKEWTERQKPEAGLVSVANDSDSSQSMICKNAKIDFWELQASF